ncbi:SLAM family member 6 isoform 1-T1 [Dama dama]|uniref:SLAM family member 6 isoform X1 n=1 Tax=Dama dama TaxID=30532 RepID=UPI002A365F54|nr:SLAM family member 6 isoform X1 [Dama dama]
MARTLTVLKPPTPFSTAKSMIRLIQSLTLVSFLGPGNSVSEASSTPLAVNGVLRESVTLPSKFPVKENISSITWLHKGNSVIFIWPKEAKIQVTDPTRKDRLNIIESYSLQLNNLTMADAGHYRAQITTSTSSLYTDYNLQIFRRLRNLQVAHHTKLSENSTCEIQLACSVENPNDNVSFRWEVAGNPFHSEANLSVSWNPNSLSEVTYTCIAENPVSNLSSSVSDKSVCKGVINGKNEYLDIRWIIIVVVLTCIFFIALILIFVQRKKVAGFFQFSTQQTQCPAETVSNLEYASFSSGNTVYVQVTHSNREAEISKLVKNNDSNTIYSEVHHPQERKPIYSRTTAHNNVIHTSPLDLKFQEDRKFSRTSHGISGTVRENQ